MKIMRKTTASELEGLPATKAVKKICLTLLNWKLPKC